MDPFAEGLAAFSRRDFSAARELFSQAVSLQPENPNYRYYHAITLRELRCLQEAADELSYILDKQTVPSAFLYTRGDIFLEMGDPAKAEADFSAVITLDEEDDYWKSLACLGRGLIFLENGLVEEAISDLSSAEDLANKTGDSSLLARISSELEKAGF